MRHLIMILSGCILGLMPFSHVFGQDDAIQFQGNIEGKDVVGEINSAGEGFVATPNEAGGVDLQGSHGGVDFQGSTDASGNVINFQGGQ